MAITSERHARFGAVLCLLAGAWIAWYWINASAEPGVSADAQDNRVQPSRHQPTLAPQPQPTTLQRAPQQQPDQAPAQPPAQIKSAADAITNQQSDAQPTADSSPDTNQQPVRYLTQHNDNLSNIAQRHYGRSSEWERIYNANRETITNPNRIPVGIWIIIPPPRD